MMRFGKGLHFFNERARDLAQQGRRRNRIPTVTFQKVHQAARGLQRGHIPVQVNPIHTLDFQRHMVAQQFSNRRHGHILPAGRIQLMSILAKRLNALRRHHSSV